MNSTLKPRLFFYLFLKRIFRIRLSLISGLKEMEIGEMDRFMYHTLKSLCDTYTKATNHAELGNEMIKW